MAATLEYCENCSVRSECATLNQSPPPPYTVEESTILAIRLSIARSSRSSFSSPGAVTSYTPRFRTSLAHARPRCVAPS